ncbi:MAG: ABC transporter permease subunit [Chloroflexi bacterium]|nr:ABC transporter permease subunit [Chloroflexota bacterium]
MSTTLYQLRGMIWYELKMHWRRRALKVMMLALFVLIVITSLLQHTEDFEKNVYEPVKDETGLSDAELNTWFTIFSTWFVGAATLGFILPIGIADTIPLDRQSGVSELFHSFPVTRGTYVLGKVMGVWAAVLWGNFVLMVITGVLWWFFLGSYQPLPYISMWVLGLGALTVLNGGLGVLLGATQPNRLRAVLLTIGVMFILPNFLGLDANTNATNSLWDFMSPLRWPIFAYYTRVNQSGALADAIVTAVVGIGELIMIGIVMWCWLRWKEQH